MKNMIGYKTSVNWIYTKHVVYSENENWNVDEMTRDRQE